MKKSRQILIDLMIALLTGLLSGTILAFVQPPPLINAWLASSGLMWLSSFIGLRTWRLLKGGRKLAILLITAFVLRIGLGAILHNILPDYGFDNPVQNAGYVYSDAYTRDQLAFSFAQSHVPLFATFSPDQSTDQYGGLLFISTAVYRSLSPDAARPLLITIISALMMTLGLAFLFDGVRSRWGEKTALVTAWVFALYPEGVLLGSSQMREPFVIGLTAIGFWAALTWQQKPIKRLLLLAAVMLLACLISIPLGLICSTVLASFIMVEWIISFKDKTSKLVGFGLLTLLGISTLIAGWVWLKPTLYYDAYLTETGSGMIQVVVKQLGSKWRIPFTTAYGLFQPLLPAALTDPSLPVWMTIAIIRATGWYLVIPFIIYGLFAVWKKENNPGRWMLASLTLGLVIWIVIASARAGGDQWDNPRYRAVFLPWLALVVAWVWQRVLIGYRKWFFRVLKAEGIFLLFFTIWYSNRHLGFMQQISFLTMSVTTAACVVIYLAVVLFLDRQKMKRPKKV